MMPQLQGQLTLHQLTTSNNDCRLLIKCTLQQPTNLILKQPKLINQYLISHYIPLRSIIKKDFTKSMAVGPINPIMYICF